MAFIEVTYDDGRTTMVGTDEKDANAAAIAHATIIENDDARKEKRKPAMAKTCRTMKRADDGSFVPVL